MVMTDVMVDLESTGTDPAHSAIIQIAAVQFNYDTEEIGPIFNRCLLMAPHRFWNEDTRTWWGKQNKVVFDSISARQEPPEQVFRDFLTYASVGGNGLRLWAKPITFEWGFLASHFAQYGLPMPFHYRVARDLNTHVAALAGGADHVEMEHLHIGSSAHDALADCVQQLRVLFAAKAGDFGAHGKIVDAEYEEIVE
jgi:DNA polymerase III epsilon subunit-like protein